MIHLVFVFLTTVILVGCAPSGIPLKLTGYVQLRDMARDGLRLGRTICLDPKYSASAECKSLPLVTEQLKEVDRGALDAFEQQISQGEKMARLDQAIVILTRALEMAAKFGLMP
jgi:hypothetical protein